MEISDPTRVEMAMLRTARLVRQAFNHALSPLGLSLTEASALSFLRQHRSLSQRQLSDLLQVSRPSAGSVIDGLERRGLVLRKADATDRRVWLVELTSDAEPYVNAFEKRLRSIFS